MAEHLFAFASKHVGRRFVRRAEMSSSKGFGGNSALLPRVKLLPGNRSMIAMTALSSI
jgi:hypothetical protein